MFPSWIRQLAKLIDDNGKRLHRGRSGRLPRRPGRRLVVEQMEDRLLPSLGLALGFAAPLTVDQNGYVPVAISASALSVNGQFGLTSANIDLDYDASGGLSLDPTDVQLGEIDDSLDPSNAAFGGNAGNNGWCVTATNGNTGNSFIGEMDVSVTSPYEVVYTGDDNATLFTLNVKAQGVSPGTPVNIEIAADSQVVDDPKTPYPLNPQPVNNFGYLQTITFGGNPSGGTFTLAEDSVTTGPITYSSNTASLASNIQAALSALSTVGSGNVAVSATFAGTTQTPTVSVTFEGGFISGQTSPTPTQTFVPMTSPTSSLLGANGAAGGTLTVSSTPTFGPATTSGGIQASMQGVNAPSFGLSAPTSAVAGTPFNLTVTALNTAGNTLSGYTGTVHFSGSDSQLSSLTGGGLPADYTFTAQDAGTHVFSVILKSAGHSFITVTDAANGIAGTTQSISVTAASVPTRFVIGHEVNPVAGMPFLITVVALDQYSNHITSYNGTVHLSSSDPNAGLGSDATLTNGVGVFGFVLTQAATPTYTPTVTATDTSDPFITESSPVLVVAGPVTHFSVVASPVATAGQSITVSVVGEDAYGNTATGYTGTVHFSSTDNKASLPVDSTLTAGVGSFAAVLQTAGTQTITVSDTANTALAGSAAVTVSPTTATRLTISATAVGTAGIAFVVTVTATDSFNNVAAGYSGTLRFASNDSQAVLPGNVTLSGGVGFFAVTLKTAGVQTLTASDTVNKTIASNNAVISVTAGAASRFILSAGASVTAGLPISFNVLAQDPYGNLTTGYSGTVRFTTSDPRGTFAVNNVTLASGTGNFSATLQTSGTQTLSAADATNSKIVGNALVTVAAAGATRFAVSAPSTATAGNALVFSVTALDPFGNTAVGYIGTAHFSSSDSKASLPADSTLTAGTGIFAAVLATVGNQSLTATDIAGNISTSATISVVPAAPSRFAVTVPTSATAGKAFNFTVTALDASGNVATGYTGTLGFTTTDPLTTPPSNSTLTNGVGIFPLTLDTAGNQKVVATDTATGISASGAVVVSSAAASRARRQCPQHHHGRQSYCRHRDCPRHLRKHRHRLWRHRPFQQHRRSGGAAGRRDFARRHRLFRRRFQDRGQRHPYRHRFRQQFHCFDWGHCGQSRRRHAFQRRGAAPGRHRHAL